MRSVWICIWIIGFACLVPCVHKAPASGGMRTRHVVSNMTPAPDAANARVFLQATGSWQANRGEAKESALEQAIEEVRKYFEQEGTDLHSFNTPIDPRSPKPNNRQLRAKIDEYLNKFQPGKNKELTVPGGPPMNQVTLDLEIGPRERHLILEEEQAFRETERKELAGQRMKWLGIALAGIVLLLGAVVGYLQLDEWTKGYYTGWLRFGVGLVAAVAVASGVLFLLMA